MKHLSIDIETYSEADIRECGAYCYAMDPSFEILLFAYSVDGKAVKVVDVIGGEKIPADILTALTDESVTKHAFNAAFEWCCLSQWLGYTLPQSQWEDTMLKAVYCGLPASLAEAGQALGLDEDKRKMSIGKALITYFCKPCKPTEENGGRERNYPHHDRAKWELFKQYNAQDVVTEMAIADALPSIQLPEKVQKQWETDLRINSRGIAVDFPLVRGALALGETVRQSLTEEAIELTGLSNPNSVQQLTQWLSSNQEMSIPDLRKDTVARLIKTGVENADAERVLRIRQELGKTSLKKYQAITDCICPDKRIRGTLQFYGAGRTGRWAGRLVQVQNLPRTYLKQLDSIRDIVESGIDADCLPLFTGYSVNDTLSQLIRTAFIPGDGKMFIDADFSAIEARVIAWLAGEEWRQKVFAEGGDIYCASASQMFKVPVVKGGVNGHLRQKGKIAELALGYQGASGALEAMGALDMGLTEEELPDIVTAWRQSNPHIVQLWNSIEAAAVTAISGVTNSLPVGTSQQITFRPADIGDSTALAVDLPSGRSLHYYKPCLASNRWGKPSISYTDGRTTLETYGGKLTENIVQAMARDCLAEAIERLETAGYAVVFHIHDEVVIEAEHDGLEEVTKIMCQPVDWAEGLILNAEGWTGYYFKKD